MPTEKPNICAISTDAAITTAPLVILTSKASASAAEIVAQALQDYGTGIVVGDERTYGKGTIQYQTVTDSSGLFLFQSHCRSLLHRLWPIDANRRRKGRYLRPDGLFHRCISESAIWNTP